MRHMLVALIVGVLGILVWSCASIPAGHAGTTDDARPGNGVDIRIRMWVGAATRIGFVGGKGMTSSVTDVRERFRSETVVSSAGRGPNKVFVLVDDPKQAVILVTITDRGQGQEQYGQRSIIQYGYYNTEVLTVPVVQNAFWVDAVREIVLPDGTIDRREIVGSDSLDWGGCASEIVASTTAWTVANWAQLVVLKPRVE